MMAGGRAGRMQNSAEELSSIRSRPPVHRRRRSRLSMSVGALRVTVPCCGWSKTTLSARPPARPCAPAERSSTPPRAPSEPRVRPTPRPPHAVSTPSALSYRERRKANRLRPQHPLEHARVFDWTTRRLTERDWECRWGITAAQRADLPGGMHPGRLWELAEARRRRGQAPKELPVRRSFPGKQVVIRTDHKART